MKKINSICVISPAYPTKEDPTYVFVENLCNAFAIMGLEVTVISPQSVTHAILHRKKLHPVHRKDIVTGASSVNIYQPYCITLPNRYKSINNVFFRRAAKRVLRQIQKSDVYYCHFWRTAVSVYPILKKMGVPMFVATGESNIKVLLGNSILSSEFVNYIRGVIAVSTKNKNESIGLGLTTIENCEVIPNAISTNLFSIIDRQLCRTKLSFPSNVFIVIFVGWFIDRKGVRKLSAALEQLNDVYSIFIGAGDYPPTCKNILFCGRIPHDEITTYLNAADVFVLPTLNEGCSNAIVEAMACGLPIVSSDLDFNKDILDETNSILIDPCSIDDIKNSILELKNNESKRRRLSDGSYLMSQELTIESRARKIISFIQNKL